jgi:hypothetical protein
VNERKPLVGGLLGEPEGWQAGGGMMVGESPPGANWEAELQSNGRMPSALHAHVRHPAAGAQTRPLFSSA